MSDTILYYSKEMTIQLLGGIIVGSSVNWLFPYPKAEMKSSNVLKTTVEVVLQIAACSTMSVFYFSWLQGRGWDPVSTAIGTAPFWIFMFGAQPKLTQKAGGLMKYFLGYVESLDQSLANEARKDVSRVRNDVLGAL
jgi:hypothetical protein